MAKKYYVEHPDLIEDSFGILKLKIMDFFHVDYNLPKYVILAKNKVNVETNQKADSEAEAEGTRLDMASVVNAVSDSEYRKERYDSNRASYERNAVEQAEAEAKLPWYKKLFRFFRQQAVATPVEKTFDYIKAAKKALNAEQFKNAMQKINDAIEYAKMCGQKNLALSIMTQRQIIVYEATLADNGFKYYVDEQDVIEFMKRANRGVAIDYIRYFTGYIPKEAAELKKKADDLLIFDNYCVMYFDTNRNILKLNAEQVRKAKDPIIFGMIKNSKRLYFIADWTTPDDDLTLDKFYEVLGNPALMEEQKLVEMRSAEMHDIIENLTVAVNSNHFIPLQEWVGDDPEDEVKTPSDF